MWHRPLVRRQIPSDRLLPKVLDLSDCILAPRIRLLLLAGYSYAFCASFTSWTSESPSTAIGPMPIIKLCAAMIEEAESLVYLSLFHEMRHRAGGGYSVGVWILTHSDSGPIRMICILGPLDSLTRSITSCRRRGELQSSRQGRNYKGKKKGMRKFTVWWYVHSLSVPLLSIFYSVYFAHGLQSDSRT